MEMDLTGSDSLAESVVVWVLTLLAVFVVVLGRESLCDHHSGDVYMQQEPV